MRAYSLGLSMIESPIRPALSVVAGIIAFCAGLTARADQTAPLVAGSTITISVSADGTLPFSYQWKKNGTPIVGSTAPTLIFDPAAITDVGNYTVLVTNSVTSTESDIAILTLAPVPPTFSIQPASQAVSSGATVVFTALAIGTAPITYQWQKNGVNLANGGIVSGATSTTLSLTGVTGADDGNYSVIATNGQGSVSSNLASVLIVSAPPPVVPTAPTISVQPVGKSAFLGETVTFSVSASGLPAPTFQWRKNGTNLTNGGIVSGATFPILTLANITTADTASYTVVVTNSQGAVTSSTADLTVVTNVPPIITVHPASQTVNTGSVVFLTGRASGTPTPTSQWQRNGVNLNNGGNISGAKSNTLVLNNVTSADAANYTYVAENSLGFVVSTHAGLSINGVPAFLSQPPALSVVSSGTVVSMSVSVAGDPAPTLQWRKDGTNLTNGGIIAGVTSATLTLTGVTAADSGNYSIVATNTRGTANAGPFALTVNPTNVWYQPVTTGKDTALASLGATGNLKWQISNSTGSIWSDLANDSTYAGVTTDTLRITNASPEMNSIYYRLVSVSNGETTTIKTSRLDVAQLFLPFPVGLSTDGTGNLYVADTSIDTITKINSAGQVTSWAGTSGQTGTTDGTGAAARFNNPNGVASSSDGSLVVTDNANGTIRSISPSGAVVTIAGSTTLRGNVNGTGTAATFSSPIGIARDTGGTYYVADSTNHTLRKITTGAVVTTLAGSAGLSGNNDGTGAAARFNNLTRVAADQAGNLYVADTTNNLIRKVTPTGVVTTLAGLSGVSGTADGTGSGALFNQPGGVAVDNNGYVYVADTGNSTIRRISPTGVVITIAGLPGIAGHKDGNGIEAWFNQPRDLCLSPAGFLYVADTGNAAIRKIAADASVSTLALTALPSTPNPTPPLPLPETPALPTPLPTPPLPTGPTPVTPAPTSGGGGGGAPSLWFGAALGLLWILRRRSGSGKSA
jgi:hypothetical protein